ncbi:hypothetical protein D5S18_07900 [Nocardia panacis]|uniref:Uncharacterized protein n=1 Tax=Nocardia panacis TaxID=2340916 RepID=A0A3A4KC16_9NOCA|nr:hypothetical protein D5S18_07900 [Nocardia panacis]
MGGLDQSPNQCVAVENGGFVADFGIDGGEVDRWGGLGRVGCWFCGGERVSQGGGVDSGFGEQACVKFSCGFRVFVGVGLRPRPLADELFLRGVGRSGRFEFDCQVGGRSSVGGTPLCVESSLRAFGQALRAFGALLGSIASAFGLSMSAFGFPRASLG